MTFLRFSPGGRVLLLCLLSGLLACFGRAEPNPPPLPEELHPELQRLLDCALAQSPQMLERAAQMAVADGDAMVARSGLLPHASAYGQFNEQRESRQDLPGSQISQKTYYNVGVSQSVFHWGELRNRARIGTLRQKFESGQTAEAYRLLVNEVRGQFLQLIVKHQTLARARFGIDLAKENNRLAQGRLADKSISASEAAAATLAITRAELAADRAEEDYTFAKGALERLTGCGTIPDAALADAVAKVDPAPDAIRALEAGFLSQSEPQSFVLRNLKRQAEVERLNYDIARVQLRPMVNFVAGLSQDQVSYTANIGQRYGVNTLFAGVQVTWSIFDGFATRGAVASASARRRLYELSYRTTSDQLKAQVQHAAKLLGFAGRELKFAEDGLAAAESVVTTYKEQLGRGEVSSYDVKTVEGSLLDAQVAASLARSDYLMKSAEFLSLVQQDPALKRLPAVQP
ncbi:TolC family protein [Horticoccus luteus]|uniref:TolC family protein n=1 Tax=Horticoccus luteus TaxID=2862869 RepID=A0A8F9TXG5_9BACT|nr:TolC family protein [Horticoccus luteus]QYM79791.1 TolC family protein [Horticoccus luteus]